jgi:alpha-galactosidase
MAEENKILLDVQHDGLNLVIEKGSDGTVRLLHFSALPYVPERIFTDEKKRRRYTLAEVHCSGESQRDHHGAKHTGSNPGGPLRYIEHSDRRNAAGRKLEIIQESDRLRIVSHIQFMDGIPMVRCWTEVSNRWKEPVGIEYISSFALNGFVKELSGSALDTLFLHLPHHSWKMEFQWRRSALSELGLTAMSDAGFTMKRAAFSNTGSWAAKELLPQAVFENAATGELFFWQIETSGSWNWEIGDMAGQLYLQLSGPSERENQWWKNLQPGESFTSVPVTVGAGIGGLDSAFASLNTYRRAVRRFHRDNELLPVIFNDYMNCLMGDATTAKLLPLIRKAAEAGAEYFVVDGGWYDDGPWWDGVGKWLPAKGRFPGGIEEVMDCIRAHGMVPGLWLELERMGMHCSLGTDWPDECFFVRHGKRVIDHDSWQLDFRHPAVIVHADEVVRRVVEDYGVGYIKMDYNFDIGPGTEIQADSFGDGLLQHRRAYRVWLEKTLNTYPELIIENCSSGGLRLTGGLMDLHSVSSTTDAQSVFMNARISINSATGVCPEQAGVWAYPLADSCEEDVIMNMVNALSWRIFLSGQMQTMEGERLDLIKEAVAFYKTYRRRISSAVPAWPLGLAQCGSGRGAFALQWKDAVLLSVWRFDSSDAGISVPFPAWKGSELESDCVYPERRPVPGIWNSEIGEFNVELPACNSARIFFLTRKSRRGKAVKNRPGSFPT